MDGGGRRDVRKQRVEGVFYGAIGKRTEWQEEGKKKKRRGIEV